MDESKVLSTEEVSAISDVAQTSASDLTQVLNGKTKLDPQSNKILVAITELAPIECGKSLSAFLRKKIAVKTHAVRFTTLGECVQNKTEKYVFSIVGITSQHCDSLVVIDLPLLHQMINILYGGQVNEQEPTIETAGGIGIIIAEKICQAALEGFAAACKEFSAVTVQAVKTVNSVNLLSKLSMQTQVYCLELKVLFKQLETALLIAVPVEFFQKIIPDFMPEAQAPLPKTIDSSWRQVIEKQVIDSYVTVTVSLPEITVKAKDLINLKADDLIPIGDPTVVNVCLNNMKIFRASAGQANANKVVKILGDV